MAQTLTHVLLLPRFNEWVLWCYMAMPGELAAAGAIDLLRTALADGFVAPVFRTEVCSYLSLSVCVYRTS
jgi:hypothetical protein